MYVQEEISQAYLIYTVIPGSLFFGYILLLITYQINLLALTWVSITLVNSLYCCMIWV
ncbi:uncharacterized protein BX663DRAFT_516238 [Cokeromyces recurvatus]|uniref:uncharacterized protein n=1 Tax=Cokeromyces recurvatus TaxID=90255 RepID=UPI00221F4E5F|nr:uncharacterized protein BX663DRAFT_516238 [Cokeromyces recurvatus]KAI7901074.1 hypothetical protein BX663DRAFT_516238 [Cokeromyces recurvatus]